MELKYLGNYNREGASAYAGSVYDADGLAPTIDTMQGGGRQPHIVEVVGSTDPLKEWTWEIDGELYLIRIRKLTPRECWRLMSFNDEDFDKASKVNSNTQLYKQAGNSICTCVMENIFKQMLPQDEWSRYMNPPIED